MTLCLNDKRDNVTQGRERISINFLSHPCVAVAPNVLEDYCSLAPYTDRSKALQELSSNTIKGSRLSGHCSRMCGNKLLGR